MPEPQDEIRAIEERYARRKQLPEASLYHPLDPYVCCARQERERALIRCLKRAGQVPVQDKRVLEVGCGGGMNLLDLIRLGFQPQNLVGNDLLEERLARARTGAASGRCPDLRGCLLSRPGGGVLRYRSAIYGFHFHSRQEFSREAREPNVGVGPAGRGHSLDRFHLG